MPLRILLGDDHTLSATVGTHRAHILEKLDVHNTAEFVLFAVRKGVIS